jgi:hypothetical protein
MHSSTSIPPHCHRIAGDVRVAAAVTACMPKAVSHE